MDSQQTLAADGATDAPTQEQGQETTVSQRVYTQEEFDNAMAKMKAAVQKKATRAYEELGDIDELRTIKSEWERKRQEEQVKRGEFEKILQDMAAKKDAEIQKRDSVIREYKVDVPLVNAAAQYRSVNPEQVRALLKTQVRLNQEGDVEVVDNNGQIRYNDKGQPLAVNDLVKEFLDANPHFVQPTPATTTGRSAISSPHKTGVDITKLDMKNPEHRRAYAEYRKSNGLA